MQGKAVYDYAAPKSHNHSAYSPTGHTHGTITLSGDVTGSGTIGSGTTAINITATVKDDSHNHSAYSPTGHTHVSSAITDSISASGSITNSASGLVQGKAVYNYAAPKSHTHSNYSTTGHTHDTVTSSNDGFAPKVIDGGTIDNSSNDLVLTSDNGTVGWRKLPTNAFKDTDTKVIQTVVSANAEYPVLLANSGQTSNTTGTTYFDSGITINPSANTINAKASSATTADKVSNNLTITLNNGSTEDTNKFTFDGSNGKTVNITASNIGAATINDINIKIAEITANAPDSFDTLKEIADWISNDTTGAAKMANDIDELKNSKSSTGHTHVSSAITDSISVSSSITNSASGLVQGKAVYNYAAPKSHTHSNYSTTGHTHDTVTSSNDGFAPKVIDGGTIDNSSNDLVLTSDNGTVGWRKLPTNAFKDTDTKVIQTVVSANAEYPVLLANSGQTSNTTGTTYFDSGITINPSANTINAKASSATTADKVSNNLTITLNNGSTEDTNKFTFDGSNGKTVNITASNIGAATINDINIKIAEITANAPDSFDTLKEIADWISNDTTGAAKMANDIDELKNSKSSTGHTHVSSAITDSISVSSSITNSASGLVQGKAVYNYAAPKSHNHSAYSPTGHTHGTITLSGDVTGSGTIGSGTTAINITATVKDDSHNHSAYSPTGHTHVSSAITDSINSMSGITGTETKLVQAKAVYELINDTEEQIAETLLEHDSRLTTLSNNFDSIVTDIEENELVTATAITELENLVNGIGEELDNKSNNGHTHVSSAITDSISVSSGITNSASGLVQGKAVYNYAAPKSHASSSTTYGAATTSNYGHVKISNGDVATVASANGLAAGMDHTHSDYSPIGHTHSYYANNYTALIENVESNISIAPTINGNPMKGDYITLIVRNSSSRGGVINCIGLIKENNTRVTIVGTNNTQISVNNITNLNSTMLLFMITDNMARILSSTENEFISKCTCNTSAEEDTKICNCPLFSGEIGELLVITFTETNTSLQPSLNVNGITKLIYYNDVDLPIRGGTLSAGTHLIMYDGNYFRLVGVNYENAYANTADTANTAGKLSTSRYIDGISFDGSSDIIHYGKCTSSASATTKTVGITGFSLKTGATALIYFSNDNTESSSVTLNINSTGAKDLKLAGQSSNIGAFVSGVYWVVYDGSCYRMSNSVSASKLTFTTSSVNSSLLIPFVEKSSYSNGTNNIKVAYSTSYPFSFNPSTGVLTVKSTSSSDARLKDFGNDIDIDFEKLKSIPKKYFTWKVDENKISNIGTSAQELEKIYPELVSEYGEEGDMYKAVNYSALSIVALAAIDKLNERIEYLENKLKEYENK